VLRAVLTAFRAAISTPPCVRETSEGNIALQHKILALFLAIPFTGGATQILLNPSFETGNFQFWTVTNDNYPGDVDSNWFVNSGTLTPLNGNPTVGSSAGSYYAVTDQFGPGTHALIQSFIDPLGTTSAILSFDIFVNDVGAWGDILAGGGSGEVDLLAAGVDALTGTAIQVFYGPSDIVLLNGVPNSYVHFSGDISSYMTPGQTYQLRVLETDTSGLFNVGVDNFALNVTTSPTPEPGTAGPMALLAGILGYGWRRKLRLASGCKLMAALALGVVLSQATYAQATAYPVVPTDSVPPGYNRPYIWGLGVADNGPFTSSVSALVHGPGRAACNTSSSCYYYPSDLQAAYGTSFIRNSNGGAGITVAIVDAYYNPQTEADLATFSSHFSLPACTVASGCLMIVSQTGGTPTAAFNAAWAQETDLDVQWVHAIAPNARILLVTATDNSNVNLYAGDVYAESHADVVSNSWGHAEIASDAFSESTFSGSPVPVLFSSGDTAGEVSYPCTSPNVTCVGGTNLTMTAALFRVLESVWNEGSGAGGGCSGIKYVPAYQSSYTSSICGSFRGVPDIAAIADPYSGALVYLGSNAGASGAGYYVFGGTSLACPVMAAMIANYDASRVASLKSKLGSNFNQLLYQGAAAPYYRYRFYDVTVGNNTNPAVTGWDAASGLGVVLNSSFVAYLNSLP